MAHEHIMRDVDKRFIIDTVNKTVIAPEHNIPVLSQYDHNSEYITFEADRFVEGHDLLKCDKVEVHYNNTNGRATSKGLYEALDLRIDPDDNSKVMFTWIVSEMATQYAGKLHFIVSFVCTDEGDLLYRWNTRINSNILVSDGINNTEYIESTYADVLAMWKQDLFGIADTEEARLVAMGDRVLASIPSEYTELTSDVFQTALFVRNEEHLDDLNNAVRNRVYAISLTDEANVLNMPGIDRHGVLLTFQAQNLTGAHMQLFVNDSGSRMYYRMCWGDNVWKPWYQIVKSDDMSALFKAMSGIISSESNLNDLNDAEPNRAYAISLSDTANVLNMPYDERHGSLLTFCRDATDGTGGVQMFIATSGRLYMRIRWGAGAAWQPWKKYGYYGEEVNVADTPLGVVRADPGLLSCFLNVGCIGDSLASGESVYTQADGSNGYADLYEHSWGQYLARMTGNKYYNWSSGGHTTETWLTSSYATECFDGEHKCEAYIIGLGQNDYNRGLAIGGSSDIDVANHNNNASSYYGNYGKIISKIKEIQPRARIFVLTDPSSATETAGYNDAVREIATMFSNVYLVDLYEHGRDLFNSGVIAACSRSGHFNAIGYREISLIIASYIDWVMRNDVSEFVDIEFIGTNYEYKG